MSSNDLDDWMTQARETGDQEAYARVVEACHHVLRAVALRDTGNVDAADEIAQEACVRGWARRSQYRPGTSPKAWLLAIVRSVVIDQSRRRDRNRRHLTDLIREELLRHRKEADDDQVHEQRLDALHACLPDVAETHRELLDLIHRDGLSTEDAAGVLGIAPEACRQRLSRVQRALRSCVERRIAGLSPSSTSGPRTSP